MKGQRAVLAAIVIGASAWPAGAQDQAGAVAQVERQAAAPLPPVAPPPDEPIDVAAIAVPSLDFPPDPALAKDFDKYYYFHRGETDFRTALTDVRDCDGLSRGLSSPYGYAQAPYPYTNTMAGAVGGAIGNLMVAAIFGSAEARAARRINMRRCMYFKGYQRYGLPKPIWETFNFEEGLSHVEESRRQAFLMQQAKVASGARPTTEALGR